MHTAAAASSGDDIVETRTRAYLKGFSGRMHRIDADCCYKHRMLRVCWTHLRALQKRLNRSRCCLGRQTRVGQGTKHSMGAHWRQLANTIERPVHSSDAVLCWRSRRRYGVNATAVRACQQYKMASSRTLLEELTKLRRSPTPRTLRESFPCTIHFIPFTDHAAILDKRLGRST